MCVFAINTLNLFCRIYQLFSVRPSYVVVHVARTSIHLLRLSTAKNGAVTFATGSMNVSLITPWLVTLLYYD